MSLRSFIDRLNGGSEKAEEDRKILLWKKWGVARDHDVSRAWDNATQRAKAPFARDNATQRAKAPFALFKEEWNKQRQLYMNLINQMSHQEKCTFSTDLNQGKILAKKRAFEDARAEKIIQVTPLITVRSGHGGESQYSLSIESGRRMNNLIGDIDEKLVARMNDANAEREEMKNLIGDIDEKLVARMNDANAEREEMKNLIGDIDEKLVARMNDANAEREEMKASINFFWYNHL